MSLGGMIAQAAAVSRPERIATLGLISAVSTFPEEVRPVFLALADKAESDGMAAMVAPTIARSFTTDFLTQARANYVEPSDNSAMRSQVLELATVAYEAGIIATISRMVEATDPRGFAATCRAIAQTNLTPHLGSIQCPTLIMSGDSDPGISQESQDELQRALPKSTQVTISNCSHLIPVERPADFNRAVLNFLAMCNY